MHVCRQNNTYVGKTINSLRNRINQHRQGFVAFLNDSRNGEIQVDDRNCLAAHIYLKHNMKERSDFERCFKFSILKISDPVDLRLLEQKFIEALNCITPFGLNHINSLNLR